MNTKTFCLVCVLLLSACASQTPSTVVSTSERADRQTVLAVLSESGQFTHFLAALKQAGLEKELLRQGPFTVFAPTDAAFAALPSDTLAMLLAEQNGAALTRVLKHHMMAGRFSSSDVLIMRDALTLSGKLVEINATSTSTLIDTAKVQEADIVAGNGVIHVVDRVLLPSF